MNLRQRTLLAIGVTLVCLIAGVFVLARGPLLRSYEDLERQAMHQDIERVQATLSAQVQFLDDKLIDWAQWDDAYRFMADRNPAFVESNLKVVSLRVDSILFVDESGRLWFERQVKHDKGVAPPNTAEMLKALKFDQPVSERPNRGGGYAGFVRVGNSILNVAVRPVRDTEGKKPGRGWMVFAQYLGDDQLRQMRQHMHLDVRLFDPADASMPADGHRVLPQLDGRANGLVAPLDEDSVAAYDVLRDVIGQPVRLLKLTEPRLIYRQGVTSVRYLENLALIAAVLFAVVILVVLEVSTLSRVSRLSDQVEKIGDQQDGDRRVRLPGKDELSRLALKINGMLNKLRENADRIKQSEEQLRTYSEGLEELVGERTRELAAKNAVLANAVEGISRLDDAGYIVTVNAAFAKICGFGREDMPGLHWKGVVHPAFHDRFRNAMHEMNRLGKSEIEVDGTKADGSISHLEIVLIASHDESGRFVGHYCFAKDISQRKLLERQLEHQAFHDAMTSLPNRLLFVDRLAVAQARASRLKQNVAVLFLDIDNFKVINDGGGHQTGDQLLKTVAKRLTECAGSEATVARTGGDEFAVLLEDLSGVDEAVKMVEQLVECLHHEISLPQGNVVLSVSIGIVFSENGKDEPANLIKAADTAMNNAKASGGASYVIFDPSMNDRVVERMDLEIGLRRALEEKEFRLQYQPLVDMHTGAITGVEALVRWNHPVRGMVPPVQFIHIAEETGMIVPLGRWVLREACAQMKTWHDQYPDMRYLSLSVNLSGKQMQRPDIVEQVQSVLAETGLSPLSLKLEITESVLMTDTEDVVAKMRRLREMGIRLAIDDFGTGYSSMSSLTAFPVDTVKIDRAFVSRIVEEEDAAGVVAAIIMLSKTMKLDVTAEGIEDEEQLKYLMALGCDTAQGFYFAKPLDSQQISDQWLENGGLHNEAA